MKWWFLAIWVLLFACGDNSEEYIPFESNSCKALPAFVKNLGIDANKSFFSTSEKGYIGIVLKYPNMATMNWAFYQDSTWKNAGYLAPIYTSPMGNIFVAPAPMVNVLLNSKNNTNTIYYIDGNTGKLNVFVELPKGESKADRNPYGIMGFTYLCSSNTLYASSVFESDEHSEKGKIFAINEETKEIIDTYTDCDAMGIGVSYIGGERRIYFGNARESKIYSLSITEDGKFGSDKRLEIDLEMVGPRGDDKVRKIQFTDKGELKVYGIEFNFNLTAPTEKQETIYIFKYNENEMKWEYQNNPSTYEKL